MSRRCRFCVSCVFGRKVLTTDRDATGFAALRRAGRCGALGASRLKSLAVLLALTNVCVDSNPQCVAIWRQPKRHRRTNPWFPFSISSCTGRTTSRMQSTPTPGLGPLGPVRASARNCPLRSRSRRCSTRRAGSTLRSCSMCFVLPDDGPMSEAIWPGRSRYWVNAAAVRLMRCAAAYVRVYG